MPAKNSTTEETDRVPPSGSDSPSATGGDTASTGGGSMTTAGPMSVGVTEKTRAGRNGRSTANAAQNQTLYFLAGHNGMALVEPVLMELGWKRTTDKADQVKIRWTECITQVGYNSFREGEMLVNHISNCGLITNKLGLLMSLRDYERRTLSMRNRAPAMQMSDFFPETYIVDDPREREAFFEAHSNGDIWINKPTGSNQGKGIFLVRDMLQFRQQMEERDQESRGNPRGLKARIVQRYILKPLLLESRKFDIRSFMLIGCTAPYIVFFHHGYIRLSIHPFNNDDSNLCTHLTNQYIQKKDPNYQQVKNDTIWSMEKFGEYLHETYAKDKGIDKNWVKNVLNRQMQKIMLHVFNSVKTKLASRVGFFELYGFDFMIDDALKVWLIEVNVNPAMHVNCDVLKNILPPMIEEVIHISVECFEKARKNKAIAPLESQKNFETIFNESLTRQSTRSSSQNSLRYWVPPRFRSNSQSPNRLAGQDDTGLSVATTRPANSQGVPSTSQSSTNLSPLASLSTGGMSKLPRVATIRQQRQFESNLRRYQKIDWQTQRKLPGGGDSSNTTTIANSSTGNRPLPAGVSASGGGVNGGARRPSVVRGMTRSQPPLGSESVVGGGGEDDPNNRRGTLRLSGGPQPQIKVKTRPPPPAREPAPVTRVQVLTGDVNKTIGGRQAMVPRSGLPTGATANQNTSSIPPAEYRAARHASPNRQPDRSS